MEIIHPITKISYPLCSKQAKLLVKQFITTYQSIGGAKPIVETLKNIDLFYDPKDDFYLNPVYGFLWTTTNILYNCVFVFNNNHLSIFVKKLFHQQNSEFRPTNKLFSFSPKDLGKYLGAMFYIQPMIEQMKKEITQYNNLKRQIKNMLKHTKNQDKLQKLQNTRDSQTDRIKFCQNLIGTFNEFKKPLNRYIHKYWNKSEYENFMFYQTVLTVVWWIANNKMGIKEYYKGLNEVLILLGKRTLDIPDDFTDDLFTERDLQRPDVRDFNLALAIKYKNKLQLQTFENVELSSKICGQKKIYPDCGETALRNFIQIMCFRENIFDMEILYHLGAIPDVISFFKIYDTVALQTSGTKSITIKGVHFDKIRARDAWGFLTSDLSNVKYGKNCRNKINKISRFEIMSGMNDSHESNILTVIKNLFSNIDNWEDFVPIIKPLRLGVMLDKSYFGKIHIFFNDEQKYTWNFGLGHSNLVKNSDHRVDHEIDLREFSIFEQFSINLQQMNVDQIPNFFEIDIYKWYYHLDYSNEQFLKIFFEEYYDRNTVEDSKFKSFTDDEYKSLFNRINKTFRFTNIKNKIKVNIFRLGDDLNKIKFYDNDFVKFDDSKKFKSDNIVEINVTTRKFQFKNLDKFENLYHLVIKQTDDFDRLNIMDITPNITHLTFGFKFNQYIDNLEGLVNLTHLTFGHGFNKPINSLKNLVNLTNLNFGHRFNKPIDSLENLVNLTNLNFGHRFDQPIDSLKNLVNLTNLNFGNGFNKPIDSLENLVNLTDLKFGHRFNQYIDSLENLVNLTNLNFGTFFNRSIHVLEKLVRLSHLTFGRDFGKYIDGLKEFNEIHYLSKIDNLTHLTLGDSFDRAIDGLSELDGLTHLIFGHTFNQAIDSLSELDDLTHLIFGHTFNQTIDSLSELDGLTHLTFGYRFNREIDSLSKLHGLTHLTFGDEFNQDINSLSELHSLTHLTFGNEFNQDIDGLSELHSLTHLTFGDEFNQDIDSLSELHSLTHLTFGDEFNQDIDSLSELHSLTHLTFGDEFNQDIDVLSELHGLIHLTFGDKFNEDFVSFKNMVNLTHLTFGRDFNGKIKKMLRLVGLTHLTFGNNFNKKIDFVKSMNLTHLTFGNKFDQEIDGLTGLVNLTHLKFGNDFNKSIDGLAGLDNLIELILGRNFDQYIDGLNHLVNLKITQNFI